MVEIKSPGSSFWKVDDLDGKSGLIDGEAAYRENPDKKQTLYIPIKVGTEVRDWGAGDQAAGVLAEELGKETKRWINQDIVLGYENRKTAQGTRKVMMAHKVKKAK